MKKQTENKFLFQDKLNSLLVKLEFEIMEQIKHIFLNTQNMEHQKIDSFIEVSLTYFDKKEKEYKQKMPYLFWFKDIFRKGNINMFCDRGMHKGIADDIHRIRVMEWPELSEPYCVLFYDLLWRLIAYNDTPIIDKIWIEIKLTNDYSVPFILNNNASDSLNQLNNSLANLEIEMMGNVKKTLVFGEIKISEEKGFMIDYIIDTKVQYCNDNDDNFIHQSTFMFTYKQLFENKNLGFFIDGNDHHENHWPILQKPYCYLLHELLDQITQEKANNIDKLFYQLHYTEKLGIKLLANGESRKLFFSKLKSKWI